MRITVDSLSKRYGRVHALDGVTLTIEPGQIVSVIGVNGAGKTTLLRCLSGIVVGSGTIWYDGAKFTRGSMDLRRRLAFLPDFPVAFPQNTVLRHIGMVLRLYGADEAAVEPRVLELLRGFDLLPLIDTQMAKLSRGQAYKAALTALLAVSPELLLLDEPFASGMDPNGITFLKREARAAAARGHTVIYSTQILDIAETLSDRVLVIERGQARYYAPLEELNGAVAGCEGGGVLERLFQQLRSSAS
jgi:ABC-type multidrug transport system ATPase subunit